MIPKKDLEGMDMLSRYLLNGILRGMVEKQKLRELYNQNSVKYFFKLPPYALLRFYIDSLMLLHMGLDYIVALHRKEKF
jgi:hypothetical protein